VLQRCVRNVDSIISTCNIPEGSAGLTLAIDRIVPISIFARNGDSIAVQLELTTSAGGKSIKGSFVDARADFANTIEWLGLVPSAASKGLTLTSGSGFDYLRGFAPPQGGVPEPASWALLITGFGLTGSMLRRRRHIAA
jgi:hypothetical protein